MTWESRRIGQLIDRENKVGWVIDVDDQIVFDSNNIPAKAFLFFSFISFVFHFCFAHCSLKITTALGFTPLDIVHT